jgi:hypothetical protein
MEDVHHFIVLDCPAYRHLCSCYSDVGFVFAPAIYTIDGDDRFYNALIPDELMDGHACCLWL